MSLDLTRVALQVESMVARLKAGLEERQERLHKALDVLSGQTTDLGHLKRKIATSKTTWLVAGLVDGLDRHYPATPLPPEFNVIATDGSHIDVDRHRSIRCFLVNVGSVILHYCAQSSAVLDSYPRLYSGDEELVIVPAGGKSREQPVEGTLLGIKRGVEECQRLAEIAAGMPPSSSTLALLDGSLILWSLEAYPEFVTEVLLDRGFIKYLDDIRKLNNTRRVALASYISFPHSTDVINALRVAICPHELADCDRYCSDKVRDCEAVAGVQDRELFINLLAQGERSALFNSSSKIVGKRYGVHHVYFFYLRLDEEIARIEIPQWVATDEYLLNLVHTLVLDQCQRGYGYPVALSEAHEKAVVTNVDKEQFWQLVESSLLIDRLLDLRSAKSRSKRTRWV